MNRLKKQITAPLAIAMSLCLMTIQVNSAFARMTNYNDSPMKIEAKNFISQIKSMLQRAEKAATKAEGEKDFLKAGTLNEKVVSLKGNLRVAEQAFIAMVAAMNAGNQDAADHEFNKINIAYQNATVASNEADSAIGRELSYTGGTIIKLTIDPATAALSNINLGAGGIGAIGTVSQPPVVTPKTDGSPTG